MTEALYPETRKIQTTGQPYRKGTVTCTGNDGWSTSTTVELRNGEIWFYRNKDSIEASIGFDEHGQNSNSATARVTRINASNSGLLLSCQNTPGLYIYKNSLRAWVNLDMNHKSIINSSDERLKTNILPFTSSVLLELGRLGIGHQMERNRGTGKSRVYSTKYAECLSGAGGSQ